MVFPFASTSDTPRVGVVVPCHNLSRFLPSAVDSVVSQTSVDWEIVIVNDGSSDDTAEVADRLVRKHSGRRIIAIDKPRGGVSDARNAGIERTAAPYILPLDADDELEPTMIERTAAVLDREPGVAVVYTDFVAFDESGRLEQPFTLPEYDFELLCGWNTVAYCSLFRREAWRLVGGYDTGLSMHEDWNFWICLGERRVGFHHLREPLFRYRRRVDGLATRANRHDLRLRAGIVTRHPNLYNDVTKTWARAVLDHRDDSAVPHEILARNTLVRHLQEENVRLRGAVSQPS
jgi:glycosyltransferase involved in cell wall biosynthesis